MLQVTFCMYKELLESDTVPFWSRYLSPWNTVSGELPLRVITGFTVSTVTNEPSVIFSSVTRS